MDQTQPASGNTCQACAGVDGATHTCGMASPSCPSCGHEHKNADGSCDEGGCTCGAP